MRVLIILILACGAFMSCVILLLTLGEVAIGIAKNILTFLR